MSKHSEGVNRDEEPKGQCDESTANQVIWGRVRAKLAEYLSPDAFNRWFKNAELIGHENGEGVVGVHSDMQQIWIETNYLVELRAAFAEGAAIHCTPRVVVQGMEQTSAEFVTAARKPKGMDQIKVVVPEVGEGRPDSFDRRLKKLGINPECDFESFVVGDNSQFAHAACSAVASQEGRSFNPLFIHGRAGLGKTHLMSAVAQQYLLNNPKAKVVFLTA